MTIRELLEKQTKEVLIDILVSIKEDDVVKDAFESYTKQIKDMTKFMKKNSFVDFNLEDKEDKKFDRGKEIMKMLPQYISNRDDMYSILVPIKEETVLERKSDKATVTSLRNKILSSK